MEGDSRGLRTSQGLRDITKEEGNAQVHVFRGSLGYWVTGLLGYWVTGLLGYWVYWFFFRVTTR